MVITKNDMKRKRKEGCSLLVLDDDPNPKRTKVHAQRKFAQGSNVNSPVITPVNELEVEISKTDNLPEPVELLPIKRPNTEDFLTFLCFRGTPILPPSLNFFNTASIVDTNGQVHEIKSESPKNGPIDTSGIAKSGSSEKPFIAFGVRKRADPIVISRQMDKKRRHALTIAALRRKYQEQKMAKIRALTISKLSEKVTNKTMVRTNSISKTETITKKTNSIHKTKVRVVATKHVKVTTQTLKSSLRPQMKPKMCLRSFRGRFVQKELQFRNVKKRLITEKKNLPKVSEKKVLQRKDNSKQHNFVKKQLDSTATTSSCKVTPKPVKKVIAKKTEDDSLRVTRSGHMINKPLRRPIKKKIVLSVPKACLKLRSLRSTTIKKSVISKKRSLSVKSRNSRVQSIASIDIARETVKSPDANKPSKLSDSVKKDPKLINKRENVTDIKSPENPKLSRFTEGIKKDKKNIEDKKVFKQSTVKKEEPKIIDIKKNIKCTAPQKELYKLKGKYTDTKKTGKVNDLKKDTLKSTYIKKENKKELVIKPDVKDVILEVKNEIIKTVDTNQIKEIKKEAAKLDMKNKEAKLESNEAVKQLKKRFSTKKEINKIVNIKTETIETKPITKNSETKLKILEANSVNQTMNKDESKINKKTFKVIKTRETTKKDVINKALTDNIKVDDTLEKQQKESTFTKESHKKNDTKEKLQFQVSECDLVIKKEVLQKDSIIQNIPIQTSQRPSRKTKEAAAIYMEILSHKLVNENKMDDDNISIDSFPELPNVKRTEQRENELKAQARCSKDEHHLVNLQLDLGEGNELKTKKLSGPKTKSTSQKNFQEINDEDIQDIKIPKKEKIHIKKAMLKDIALTEDTSYIDNLEVNIIPGKRKSENDFQNDLTDKKIKMKKLDKEENIEKDLIHDDNFQNDSVDKNMKLRKFNREQIGKGSKSENESHTDLIDKNIKFKKNDSKEQTGKFTLSKKEFQCDILDKKSKLKKGDNKEHLENYSRESKFEKAKLGKTGNKEQIGKASKLEDDQIDLMELRKVVSKEQIENISSKNEFQNLKHKKSDIKEYIGKVASVTQRKNTNEVLKKQKEKIALIPSRCIQNEEPSQTNKKMVKQKDLPKQKRYSQTGVEEKTKTSSNIVINNLESSESDIDLKTLISKTKNKKFSKTRLLPSKDNINFSDSDDEPLSKLTTISTCTSNAKIIPDKAKKPDKSLTKNISLSTKATGVRPHIINSEKPEKVEKPKRECAKRPQNYLPMLSSSDDDDEFFHGFGIKTDSPNKHTLPIAEKCSILPPSSDLLSKDISRRFGKVKVNMSNEQIEKWLKESALAGSSIKKENDEMLKFGERIPTETTLETAEPIDTQQLKVSLLTSDLVKSEKLDLDSIECTPTTSSDANTRLNMLNKSLSPDRKPIFRKDKQGLTPNINAFSPENESSVYAFGEENDDLVNTPFRRPSRRPSSTATSRSEDELLKLEDLNKIARFRKPTARNDQSKCGKEDSNIVIIHSESSSELPSNTESNEVSHQFYIPQKPCKQAIGKSKNITTATTPKSKLIEKTSKSVDRLSETSEEVKYKIPSSPSASSSSSAKLYKRQTATKSKGRPLEICNPIHVSEFPKNSVSGQLVEAPIFHPSDQEFQDPLEYIERIRHKAEQFGVCRIVPPSSFKPECKVADDMRFTAYNQYVHKMLHRWGPNFKEFIAIRKYLTTQNISLVHPPWIGGMEIDLPRLYQTVQTLGGLKEVIEKKKWPRVSELMRIPKSAQDRVTKLDDIYCKYLLPYDTLSPAEREKLFDEVETEWAKRESKTLLKAQQHIANEAAGDADSDSEDNETEECIVKGRNMALNAFYRIARNTMSMYFKNAEPTAQDVEQEFWKHVTLKENHICVHSGSIDSGSWGYGFAVSKNSPFARHAWNLKVLTNNSGSVLRSLGPMMGVTVPTLHVGMVFSACCWYRDPHGLPWIEYLHTGGNKIWYGIPNSSSDVFHTTLMKLVPNYCRNKALWLPSDTAMIPPSLLIENNVSLCRTVQEPGQFVIVFPKTFTSSISTGYVVSESVYFAPPYWLKTARSLFDELRESCEPSMFSLDRLLLSIASDSRSNIDVLKQIIPQIEELTNNEIKKRERLKHHGITTTEKLPLPEAPNSRKRRKLQGEDSDYECDICRMNLFISMVVDITEEVTYCLEHAFKKIEANECSASNCKFLFTYTDEELLAVTGNIKSLVDSKLQKKIPNKFAGMPTLLNKI